MMKQKNFIKFSKAVLQNDYTKIEGLTFFLKGWLEDDAVTALDAQESYRLSSYAKANCLIKLDEERTTYKAGETVEVHIF
jgi:molybdopterin molybdotransferase